MAVDPDALLLDHVFQPVANALASWASPFGLARGALVVAVEAQLTMLYWDATVTPSAANFALTGMAGALTVFGAVQAWHMIMRAERQARTGMANLRRITLRGQRLTWLGVCAGCIALLSTQGDIRGAAGSLGCAAWVALVYFVSCDRRPPAMRRARAPSSAMLTG